MTHYLVELYSPKPTWAALDAAGRAAFFEEIGAGMGALVEMGVAPLTLSEVEAGFDNPAQQRFLAIWRCPDKAAAEALVSGISASGWHDYFETVNAVGAEAGLEAHLAQLAEL
ncbi:MAG TPA: hypothetical protein PKC09_04880 [Paracoccus sp. (in: a-proteobacteria)]|uniref:DUF6616 family protein n=1 Tax=uncultured Paracoccus sp. TaxID=189685 RepID=UPI002620E1F9|nr:DUF6616 family protein [uncultured Paracoccus sp.]HMQ40587.1 hypothetical protein [Paracoccus sp. (in: a-proteobacteria)]HMR36532.1 hypothetical protein [Paracoccus sp. (in: a-proteobacteria)]